MGSPWLATLLLALCLPVGFATASVQPESVEPESDEPGLPTVLIVATGGTIAGVQDDPDDPARYRAGSLDAAQIIASVPELEKHARIETLQFSNVPSPKITPEQWVQLSRQITQRLKDSDDLVGIVVTHGTDRLEETAFFLHLTVQSKKPVVVVGAQRPATNSSADGPANLLAAVKTAAATVSRDKGVLVVMDERILSARTVRKDYPRMGGFMTGQIGLVGAEGPEYLFAPTRPHTHRSEFKLAEDTVLPAVDLVFSYSGGVGPQYHGEPPAGVVFAATSMRCEEMLSARMLARNGSTVVTAFPTGESLGRLRPVEESAPARAREGCAELEGDPRWEGKWIPSLPAQRMTPQKARILLMLALEKTRDRGELERIFTRY
ncbi:MAG: asparaginase [Chromatocurvus sp.]